MLVSPMGSKRTVLLMEPSELHMHERSRAEELLRHLLTFSQKRGRDGRRRCVFLSALIEYSAQARRCRPALQKGSGSWVCVVTGISGGLDMNVKY